LGRRGAGQQFFCPSSVRLNGDGGKTILLAPNKADWSEYTKPNLDPNLDPYGAGLKLNISESDNAQDLDLLREVAPFFRLGQERAVQVLGEVLAAVKGWAMVAEDRGLSAACRDRMGRAFRVAK
jgi:hypothetical protein